MQKQAPQQNPWLNLIINILLPVFVLNKAPKFLDPKWTLLVALAFPLTYGIQDYIRHRHKNYVSLLGLLNIALTGGLALMHLQGKWFALKEATLPCLLGLLVYFSSRTKNPAARMIFCNPQIMDLDLIDERLKAFQREGQFEDLLRKTTVWLSISFLISAVLNFFLANRIFLDIDPNLESSVREHMLNDQIANMTLTGFAVIAGPLMLFSGILVYLFLKKVAEMTETDLNVLLKG
jgi:hypothetical protein